MSKIILDTFRKVLKNQNMYVEESPSLLYTFLSSILSFLQGYNHLFFKDITIKSIGNEEMH